MDTENKVMMVFVAFAVAIGLVCGLIGLTGPQGFLLAVAFFYVAYRIMPQFIDFENSSYERSITQILKTGAIPYWFLLLVSWTLVFTLRF